MEPDWHRTIRTLFIIAFVLVWLESMGCFVCFSILAREGSPIATPALAAGIVNHGHVFYVAAWQKWLYDLMLTMMQISIPGIMITALLLHHVIGVKIFTGRS